MTHSRTATRQSRKLIVPKDEDKRMTVKVKKIRLRIVCDLCRDNRPKKRHILCDHKAYKFLPADMRVSELPPEWQLEINPK